MCSPSKPRPSERPKPWDGAKAPNSSSFKRTGSGATQWRIPSWTGRRKEVGSGSNGRAFAVSHGLLQDFGPERIRDAPLSESTFVGAGIGAALNGMRPIVEIMNVNFSLLGLY